MKYFNEHLFKLEIHSFSLLNFDNSLQVKSFENFKYSKTHKLTSIWDLENNPEPIHNNSGELPFLNNKDFTIKITDDNLTKKRRRKS